MRRCKPISFRNGSLSIGYTHTSFLSHFIFNLCCSSESSQRGLSVDARDISNLGLHYRCWLASHSASASGDKTNSYTRDKYASSASYVND